MNRILFLYLLACTIGLNAQDLAEFAAIDHKALAIPVAATHASKNIAQYISENFRSDKDKIRAAYAWITANIRYNTDSMYSINWSGDDESKIAATLRRRKGVCENYATLFNDIVVKCGIPAFVVTGYTRQGGSVVQNGHCWGAVYVDKEWLFCDPTWDEGFKGTARYFLVSPGDFIDTHFPFDPLWQLLTYPVTVQEFNRGTASGKTGITPVNYSDSAKNFLSLGPLQQLEASTRRIQQAGSANNLQKNWQAYVKMKIAIFYEDDDMNLYNSAVEDLNKANTIFNRFVQYRNNQFTPLKADNEINQLLSPIAANISSAAEKVNKIGKTGKNFQYDTSELQSRLSALTKRVQEQQDFLRRYFASNVSDRSKLFYR